MISNLMSDFFLQRSNFRLVQQTFLTMIDGKESTGDMHSAKRNRPLLSFSEEQDATIVTQGNNVKLHLISWHLLILTKVNFLQQKITPSLFFWIV